MEAFDRFPMLLATISTTVMYIASFLFLRHYTLAPYNHPHLPVFNTLILLNSRFYSLFCLVYLILLLSSGLSDSSLRTVYHLTKLYESIDVSLVQLTASTPRLQPIDLHFFIHHLTTPYFTYIRVLPPPPASYGWRIFASLNKAHHVLMYAYFGKMWGQQSRLSVKALRVTGVVQLLAGICWELWILGVKRVFQTSESDAWRNLTAMGLLALWLVLTIRDMKVKDRTERKSRIQDAKISRPSLNPSSE